MEIDRFAKQTQTSRCMRVILLLIALSIAAYLILPFVAQSLYTVPAADDFFAEKPREGENLLLTALQNTVDLYKHWQGTYLGEFLGSLFRPYQTGGLSGEHTALCIVTVLFVVSLYYMILCFTALVTETPLSLGARLLIACGIFATMTLGANSSDTFTWCSSVWVYTIPLSMQFLSGGLLARAALRKRYVYAVASGVLLFLASGGTLVVASFGCLISIAGVLLALGTRSSVKYSLTSFLSALLGTVINMLAPGNFLRHSVITSDYRILRSLMLSATTVAARLLMLLEKTPAVLLFLLLLAVSTGWAFSDRMKRACTTPMLLCLLACLPALILIPFPMILGYDSEMALRGYVVLNTAIALWLATLAIYLGCWIQQKTPLRFRREDRVLVALLTCCIFFAVGGASKLKTAQQSVIISQLADGQYAAFFEDRANMLAQIASSPDEDVTVTQHVSAPTYIRDIGLNSNPDSFGNTAVASYFGKNSVVCIFEEVAD